MKQKMNFVNWTLFPKKPHICFALFILISVESHLWWHLKKRSEQIYK